MTGCHETAALPACALIPGLCLPLASNVEQAGLTSIGDAPNLLCSCAMLRAVPTELQVLTLRACTTPSGAMLAVWIP